MTPRTQRRAAERKARKAEQKKLRHQPPPPVSPEQPAASSSAAAAPAPISEIQLAANRANAALSTGPVTDLGKSISSRNHFRHGLTQLEGDPILLDSESPEEYAAALAGFEAEWQPQSETEYDLVNRLASHRWLRRRALNLQKRFLNPADGLITDEKQFNLYRRYEVQHERAFNKALSDLLHLRALRTREQNGFESQRRKNEKHDYQIRHLQHREKMHWLKEVTAESNLTLAQGKLNAAGLLISPSE